jgi:DNA polymerase III epsilon subunit-like protein
LHEYLQPDREIDPRAIEVHGISNEFLAGQAAVRQSSWTASWTLSMVPN